MSNLARRGRIAVLIVFLASTAACSSSNGLSRIDVDGADATVVLDASADANCDPSLTYASFGMSFFGTYCNRCHSWDHASAQLDGQVISSAAGTGGFMPPGPPSPTSDERMRLVQWIDCGAP